MLKEFLSQRGVAFTERDISVDRAAAGEVARLTGQMAVPVTVIDNQVIVGFDRPKLEQVLAASANHASLGAAVADAARIMGDSGAYVGSVKAGSLAQRMGLGAGDVIKAVNGQPVADASDLERLMRSLRPGSRINLSFSRGGNPLTASGSV
jgi:S1-C subfamily serine protease